MKKIVVCATHRSGSTLLVRDMRNSEVLGRPREWSRWDPDETGVNWSDALQTITDRTSGQNGVMSVKVMATQLLNIDRCMASFVATEKVGQFPHFAEVFENATWIKVSRRGIVSQAISRIMARQTGIYHATGAAEERGSVGKWPKGVNEDYNAKATYRYGAIREEITKLTLENIAWDRFFKQHRIAPRELIYEDFMSDPEMLHLDVIARLAGVEEVPRKAARDMVKVANHRNYEWHEKFIQDMIECRFGRRPKGDES